MPEAMFGLPKTNMGCAKNATNLVSTSTVANVELVMPDLTFTLIGRTQAGTVQIRASESMTGSVKSTTYLLYRDGVMIATGTLGDVGDHTDGNQHRLTLTVPAQIGGGHQYYVTWALNLNATLPNGLYSAQRAVSVLAYPAWEK